MPSREGAASQTFDRQAWRSELADLIAACEAEGSDPDDLVAATYTVMCRGPGELAREMTARLPVGELMKLLACGATESAAIRMAQACGNFMVSWGGDVGTIATTQFLRSGKECHSDAPDLAVAMCGAILTGAHFSFVS